MDISASKSIDAFVLGNHSHKKTESFPEIEGGQIVWKTRTVEKTASGNRPTAKSDGDDAIKMVVFLFIASFLIAWFYFAFVPSIKDTALNQLYFVFGRKEVHSWLVFWSGIIQWKYVLPVLVPVSVSIAVFDFICNEEYKILNAIAGFCLPIIAITGIPLLLIILSIVVISCFCVCGFLLTIGGEITLFFWIIWKEKGLFIAIIILMSILMIGFTVAFFVIPILKWLH